MTALIVLFAAAFYIFFYFTYGKALERNVVRADGTVPTPAVRLRDNIDYIPANKFVLFGHHFASIAGAGPIVGPAIAVVWGWFPGLLWVWFGNLFIGSIHDYLSLMASVRYDGKSIQWVSGELMGKSSKYIFEVYIYFTMILIVAAFMGTYGALASKSPEILTASVLFMVAALVEGQLLYKTKLPFWLSSAIGVALTIGAIVVGFIWPFIKCPNIQLLYMFQVIYIILAAALPVWFLLQPRDYLNSYILWGGIIIASIAAVFAFRGFSWPAYTSFAARVISGQPSPFWPTVPLVIACGALSGFHSIVGSGTTSKQLDNELSGLFVGYGAMFMEGMLSTIVITSIGAFGFTVFQGVADKIAAAGFDLAKMQSNAGYFGQVGAAVINSPDIGIGGALGIFTKSFGQMLNVIKIPVKLGETLGGLWASAFVLTTLDTTNRLARYSFQELVEPIKKVSKGIHGVLADRWVASIFAACFGWFLIAKGGNAYTALWAGFAGANQLLASIAMLTAATWVKKVQKVGKGMLTAVLIPTFFLWITVFVALIWFLFVIVPVTAAALQVVLGGFIILMLVLDIWLMFNFFKSWNEGKQNKA
ncbi:carbon starvation protein A [Candidatus Cryosericum hinesii]|jgi:carbon starvation protein|uniref:Carbon starvation protein A n=1 Tax=Candidatus Cryosericum hinesii TaxID=2290915 RepID=A0ABX9MHS1_9BACT|nr:carbon starvation protein A [Candidatus Cryosericum hinesii]RIE09160.1 carbon starvation protein A [Candidatus Cryosericum hinesii]RIE13230.1 carbon starvation protein A [Candidatus Cryosericum hinesii]